MDPSTNDPSDPSKWTGLEMVQGYGLWHSAIQVQNLLRLLRVEFPEASELELRNHILLYTQVKLTVWLVPPDGEDGGKKEPWET